MLQVIMANLLPFLIGVVVGGITYYFICKKQSVVPTDGLDDKLITNGEALEMIGNYQGAGYDKTASGHIELGILLAYVERMKELCDQNGNALSGIEYYFAKYGGGDDNYPNLETIVIYPTHKIGDNHIPFDPMSGRLVREMNGQFRQGGGNKKNAGGDLNNLIVLNRTHMSPPRQPNTL